MSNNDLEWASFETLLWLLNPVRAEAEKAYLVLFKKLVAYFLQKDSAADAEYLASLTVNRLAKFSYLRLTGLSPEDLTSPNIIHEVPKSVPTEVYEEERERLPRRALFVAHLVFKKDQERLRARLAPNQEIARRYIADNEVEDNENRRHRMIKALAKLSNEDRYLIEEYYAESPKDRKLLRRELSRQLGMKEHVLLSRVSRIRKKLMAEILRTDHTGEAQFTAYYPRSVPPSQWNTLLAYMHLADSLPLVSLDSERRFGISTSEIVKKHAKTNASIRRGAQILVVPESEAIEFNPSQIAFLWLEDYHCAEFRFRLRPDAKERLKGKAFTVRVAFYVVPVLIAEIALKMTVGATSIKSTDHIKTGTVSPYQRVFVSYSHKDSDIANQLEKAYKAIGLEYLRDIRMLRSGEKWAPVLLKRIEESEIFQLLWSQAAKRSPQVQREWQHALTLRRRLFVRPVYWEQPMPPPPRPLKNLHFAYLELKKKPCPLVSLC